MGAFIIAITLMAYSSLARFKKVKGAYSSSSELRLRTTIWDHTIYLPPDTRGRAPPLPQPVSWYSLYRV